MSRFNINSLNENLVYFDEFSSVFINTYWNDYIKKGSYLCSICPKWTDRYPFLIRKGDIICYEGEPSFIVKDILGYEQGSDRFSPSLLIRATKITKKQAEDIKNNPDVFLNNSAFMRRYLNGGNDGNGEL